jgi:protein-tyrosine phosphatase
MAPAFPLGLFRRRRRRPPFHRVAPWLFLGPALDRRDYEALRDEGVTHVVDLRAEDSDDRDLMARLGLRWRRLPIPDRAAPAPEQVDELLAWLSDGRAEEEPVVYLHCHAGFGRTPTMAIALLMHRDIPLADAHRQVVMARPGAQPTAEQDAFLRALERRLGGRERAK